MNKPNPSLQYIPPGWDYNPSECGQRIPIVILAFIGFVISSYMGLFQYGLLEDVWDPYFQEGARKVLTSDLSYALPVPDAVLGSMAYFADVLLGLAGGRDRWRTMPWVAMFFALIVGPVGFTSVLLVVSQPVIVGEWCFLCLITAFISVIIIGPGMDEMLACLQDLKRAKKMGISRWKVFWGNVEAIEKMNICMHRYY